MQMPRMRCIFVTRDVIDVRIYIHINDNDVSPQHVSRNHIIIL